MLRQISIIPWRKLSKETGWGELQIVVFQWFHKKYIGLKSGDLASTPLIVFRRFTFQERFNSNTHEKQGYSLTAVTTISCNCCTSPLQKYLSSCKVHFSSTMVVGSGSLVEKQYQQRLIFSGYWILTLRNSVSFLQTNTASWQD